jgi:hypothetical protein
MNTIGFGKKKKWTGELKKPIRVRVARPKGLAVTDAETVMKANEEMERLACDAIYSERMRKLHLLMEHYGIADKDDWFCLALALATDHIPGFQIEWPLVALSFVANPSEKELREAGFSGPVTTAKKGGGRPSKWDFDRLEKLLSAVELEKAQYGVKTDREALLRLALRREWSRPATHRGTAEQWIKTLESRLQDGRAFQRRLDKAEAELQAVIAGRNSGNS